MTEIIKVYNITDFKFVCSIFELLIGVNNCTPLIGIACLSYKPVVFH